MPGQIERDRQSFLAHTHLLQRISLSLPPDFASLAAMWRYLFLFGVIAACSSRGADLVLDFGPAGTDQTPSGFTNTLAGSGRLGRWRAVADEVAGQTNVTVLAQTSMEVVDERFPLLIYQKQKFDDFTLTTKFKLVEGIVEQMAGIVFRYQDEKGFYVIRASGLGNNVRFYKVVGGIRSQPIGPSVRVTSGEWHELKIECRGNKIRGWLNGEPVIPELTDTSFASGRIGFWTKSDSLTRFADTRINYTPRESTAVSVVRKLLTDYPRLIDVKIYTPNEQGEPQVIASKEATSLGQVGGESEKGALSSGNIYVGRDKGVVSAIQPLRDQNGDPMAVVRVMMKSFPGQTDQAILQRALPLVQELQVSLRTRDDLE